LLPPGALVARFGSDTLWSTAGNVAMQGLSFCTTLLVARLLTKDEFGQYALFLTSVALLGTLADMGLGYSLSATAAELRDSAPERLGRRVGAAYWIGCGVAAVLCVALAALSWRQWGWLPRGAGPLYLGLAGSTLLVNTVSALQTAELSGYQGFRALAAAQVLRGVVLLPLCVTAALLLRLPGVIAASAAAMAVSVVLQRVALGRERRRRSIRIQGGVELRELRMALRCSWPVFLMNLSNAAGIWGSNVGVAFSNPAGVAAVAEFGAAAQVRNMILFLPNIVGQVLMPTLASLKGGRAAEGWKLARLGVAAAAGMAVVFAAGVILLRVEMAALFGRQYREASATVALIAVGGVIYVLQSTFCYALIGYGHIRAASVSSAVAAAAMILLSGALIRWMPALGSRALAWAYVGASAVQLTVVARAARQAMRESGQSG
jgi:O-antigen/teichoic acid export membrane protein